ncbi:MAG: hypothetical protein K2H98_07460 [Duncaniella sp.]|nr:hypothetical protein [Duncaniella sp.]
MNSIIQTVITAFIVLAAVAYVVVRLLRRKNACGCDCCDSHCDGCQLVEKCDKSQKSRR